MKPETLFKKTSLLFLCSVFLWISCTKQNTQPQHPASQGVTSSLTVDDTAVANLSHSSFNNAGNFGIIAYGANGNPEVQITFSGSQQPSSGQYLIIAGTPSFGKCTFSLAKGSGTSTASSGVVTIAYSSNTYAASFSNISVSGSGGSHMVSGTVTY